MRRPKTSVQVKIAVQLDGEEIMRQTLSTARDGHRLEQFFRVAHESVLNAIVNDALRSRSAEDDEGEADDPLVRTRALWERRRVIHALATGPDPHHLEVQKGVMVCAIPVRVDGADLYDVVLPDDGRYLVTLSEHDLHFFTEAETDE